MSETLRRLGIDPHLRAFVCIEVFNHESPVLLVARDDDGDWQLLCGEEHEGEDYVRVVGIGHPVDDDPSLVEVLNLAVNEEAERSVVGGPWRPGRHTPGCSKEVTSVGLGSLVCPWSYRRGADSSSCRDSPTPSLAS
jgi:hypothetical protein